MINPSTRSVIATDVASQRRGTTGHDLRHARLAALALAGAAVLAIAGFTALGSVFHYPQILHDPVDDILASYRGQQTTIMIWFGVLVLGAALLAPAGVWLGRLVGGRLGLTITAVAVAAATVQVVGLQRWITLVPGFSAAALDPARHREAVGAFVFWHRLLGTVIGETLGYVLTAVFTVATAYALGRLLLPRGLVLAGYLAAALIATGVLVPVLGVATLSNFLGYVVWCGWLLVVAVFLVRGRRTARAAT